LRRVWDIAMSTERDVWVGGGSVFGD